MKQQTALLNNLKAIRDERGYQSDIAFGKAAGTSAKTINNLLNGRFAVKLSTVYEISNNLGVPVMGLISENHNPTIESMKAIGKMMDAIVNLNPDDYDLISGMIERLSEKN